MNAHCYKSRNWGTWNAQKPNAMFLVKVRQPQ